MDQQPSKGYILQEYFDTPDGDECLKKLLLISKGAGTFGLLASTLDVLLYSHPKGYGAMIGRYAYITLPIMGIGAAFSAATCTVANIRKADDQVNWAFGGLAAGAAWGAWKKSYRIGTYGGFGLALLAAVIKDSFKNNWHFFDTTKPPKMHTNPYWVRQDWTLTSDPGRTWKKSVNE